MKYLSKEVSFPLAKLLKEKGYDEPCSHAYKEIESPVLYIHQDKKYNNSFKKEWQNTVRKNSHMDNAVINRYSAPTVAEVIDWIFEKHEILITAMRDYDEGMFEGYEGLIDILSQGIVYTKTFDSPLKALEVAIEHTLKELI